MGTITMNYAEAIADAMKLEMRRDPRVYIYGEDVGKFGGSFGVTGYGVFKEFPDRVLDTPISETAIAGTAVGAAVAGLRPCVEILFMDFLPICMDELCNQAAKVHYLFGGQLKCPMVLRTALGAPEADNVRAEPEVKHSEPSCCSSEIPNNRFRSQVDP